MASPTEQELEDQLAAAHDLLWTLLNGQTLQTELDAFIALIETDLAAELAQSARSFTLGVDSAFAGFAPPLVAAVWLSYNRHLVLGTATDIEGALTEIYQYLHDNTGSIESRVFSNGSVSAGGSNTGSGTIRRVLVDPKGYAIQNRHAQVVSFRCVQDVNTGTTRHGSRWTVKGRVADPLGQYLPFKSASTKGDGAEGLIDAINASSDGNLILNGSFDEVTVAAGQPTTGADAALASGDEVNNWTANTITNLTTSVDDSFREEPGVDAPKKLILETNVLLTQNWDDLGISATPGVCYWAQAAAQRKSSADGTLTFRVGSLTFSVDVTTLTNNVWTLVVPTANENLYGENLSETGATNEVQLASNTTGDVWVDSFMACPMTEHDSIPYAVVSGATDSLHDDTYTFTDTLSAEGIMGLFLFLCFGRMLPHNTTPTIADPS